MKGELWRLVSAYIIMKEFQRQADIVDPPAIITPGHDKKHIQVCKLKL